MGVLRLLLALAVVFSHSWPDGRLLVGGRNAVQLFYIISGFLMSLVMSEGRGYPTAKDFYISRYLRLYPIYALVSLLTLLFFAFSSRGSQFFSTFSALPPAAVTLLIVSNVLIFGLDWVMFSGVQGGSLIFESDFRRSPVPLYRGLLIPQAWTLGVELSFYLIVPFVLKRKSFLICGLTLSLIVRFVLFYLGLAGQDPWTYRFFPAELFFFLSGAFAHQFLLPEYVRILGSKLRIVSNVFTGIVLAYVVLFPLVPGSIGLKSLLLLTSGIVLVPFLYLFGQRKWDKALGELSYPLYIVHVLVISSLGEDLLSRSLNPMTVSCICAVVSTFCAFLLYRFVGRPIDVWRKRIGGRFYNGGKKMTNVPPS